MSILSSVPVVKHVVKLHVKSDDSVFDPAVQSAVLEQVSHVMALSSGMRYVET